MTTWAMLKRQGPNKSFLLQQGFPFLACAEMFQMFIPDLKNNMVNVDHDKLKIRTSSHIGGSNQ